MARVWGVAWVWRYENAAGDTVDAMDLPGESFPTQADAETWIGESWRDLLDGGVEQVTLLEEIGRASCRERV